MTGESAWNLVRDVRAAGTEGVAGMRSRRRARLAALVRHAREASPYYRELYRDLPDGVDSPDRLPTTSKTELMARFDDWVTDRRVTRDAVAGLVADPRRIGERLLGAYTVAVTSGSTGSPGMFVIDDRNVRVNQALTTRMMRAFLGWRGIAGVLVRGGRYSLVIATGGHFMSAAIAARAGAGPLGRRTFRVSSVYSPLDELVAELNRFRPAVLLGYASTVLMLAAEQEAGRLRIRPVLVQPAGEGLTGAECDRVAAAFGAVVRDAYSSTECGFIAYACEHRWLHVNSDWVVLEPVDAEHRPVQPGVRSHTVLLSNLANRVQPILRYDLGDRVVQRPDPCPCGNTAPAIRVDGRVADVLVFPAAGRAGSSGPGVSVAPLAFGTVLDRIAGIERFQIVQTAPDLVRVRLHPGAGIDRDAVWRAAVTAVADLLSGYGLDHVRVERAAEPPERSSGGKYRPVIPLAR